MAPRAERRLADQYPRQDSNQPGGAGAAISLAELSLHPRNGLPGLDVFAFKRHTERAAQEAAHMARRQKTAKRHKPKTILRFPDLEHSKNAVVNSLAAASSQESYGHAIDEFIGWYCSEPRLAFNRAVVLRYRFFLEQRNLAPSTINVRLAARAAACL
jgi:hypothetical protein